MVDFKVNRAMLPVKFTYFFELGAVASLLPYLNVYMRSIGLTYSELSIIYGTSPFVTAVLRTFIGILADKLQKHKMVLLVCCVFSGIFHSLLLVTPKTHSITDGTYPICNTLVKVMCMNDGSMLEYCGPLVEKACTNGNCTSADPFINASSCVVKCSLPESSCLGEDEPILTLSGCGVGQNVSSELIVLQKELVGVPHSGYNIPANCSTYRLQEFSYKSHNYYTLSCPSTIAMEICHMTCDGSSNDPAVDQCSADDEAKSFGNTFWVFFSLFLMGQIFFTPIFSMIDALTYTYLGKEGDKWGEQRLWGTIGFGIFAIISGFTMDAFTDLGVHKAFNSFLLAFIMFAVLSIIGGLMVLWYKISEKITSTQLLTNLGQLLRRFPVLVLLINIFIFGLFTGIIETFLFVRLFEIGAPKVLMGVCLVINCIPEIVILMFAGTIIKRIGIFSCLCIVYVAYSIRLFVYAYLTSPWYSLLVEPLHSITFGLMYATVTFHANQITPPGMQGTIQSVIGALYFGFGKGTGSILSGQLYQAFGAQATFLGFGISGVVCLTIFIIIHFACLRKMANKEQVEIDEKIVSEVKEVEMQMISKAEQKQNEEKSKEEEEEYTPSQNKKKTGGGGESDSLMEKDQLEPISM